MTKKHKLKFVCVIFTACVAAANSSAQTLVNPSEIIVSEDYPLDARARGEEGVTAFSVEVDRSGKPVKCEIVKSSGFKQLDDIVCPKMLAKAKFDISQAKLGSGNLIFSSKITWNLYVQNPRAIKYGITFQSKISPYNPNKTRCDYSDGVYRYILSTDKCSRELLKSKSYFGIKNYNLDIFEFYEKDLVENKNAESAFNLGILLLENEYKEGIYFLEQSSSLGSALASLNLCTLYSTNGLERYLDFNPNQAIEYCILSYKQQYSVGVVERFNLIRNQFSSSIDPEILYRADTIITKKKITSYPKRITPGNEILKASDYPSKVNSRNVGGQTSISMSVSESGRVTSCFVFRSTHSLDLDQTACKRFREKAVYSPATIDETPAPMWVDQNINWRPGQKSQETVGSIILRVLFGALGAAL
ncbi:TonB/TolA, C-terminal [Sphingomonadaceae bacterium]